MKEKQPEGPGTAIDSGARIKSAVVLTGAEHMYTCEEGERGHSSAEKVLCTVWQREGLKLGFCR